MVELGFYHLTSSTLEQALPRLLEKVLASDLRAVLRAVTAERLDLLDRWLWTYDKASFLPHGTRADGHAEAQPIWLTTGLDVPNGATVLVLVEGAPLGDLAPFERVIDLFDGNDPVSLELARERWRFGREQGWRLVYWQQTERGGWRMARELAARPGGETGEAGEAGAG
jgi:DNA polymerase III subunit chi